MQLLGKKLICIFALAVLFSETFVFASESDVKSAHASRGCNSIFPSKLALGEADLSNIRGSIFMDPLKVPSSSYQKLRTQFEQMGADDRRQLRQSLKEENGYATEALPLVIQPGVWRSLKAASEQRARAVVAFMKDIYSSEKPHIFQYSPVIEKIVRTSPGFAREIVGTDSAKESSFDLSLAMDTVLVPQPDGSYAIKTLESDTGAIGGNLRMAQVFQSIVSRFPDAELTKDFVDGRQYLIDNMIRHAQRAQSFSNVKDGVSVMYTEYEDAYHPEARNWIKSEFEKHGIIVVSNWGRDQFFFNPQPQRYEILVNGKLRPITDFWLEYYTDPLDPHFGSYQRISPRFYTDEFELSHTLPDFWNHWMKGGFRQWKQNNPPGIEIMTDKGVSSLIPEMVRFYLKEEPILNDTPYESFQKATELQTIRFHQKIFADREKWVVKSRRDAGQGHGVYIGRLLGPGQTKNGRTWADIAKLVAENPIEWVVQPIYEESYFTTVDGRRRGFELRNIVNTFDGHAYAIDAVYVRNASGLARNMSGSNKKDDDLLGPSIQPILILKEK